jgi:SAM-dependent methyltransferase
MNDPGHAARSDQSAADIAAWDRAAERYVTSVGGVDDRIYSMLRAALWESLGHDLRGLDVLDLGCGHGWLSGLLVEAGARVRGIDGSATLLAHARRVVPGAEFERYDLVADALPTDRRYDRIVAHMVVADLPDLTPMLTFVRRVLRADGRFVFTLPHPCFFNYETREDAETGDLFCGVAGYLEPAEWWIESYGGHRHYHRSLTFYFDSLRQHGLAVTRLYEPPHVSRKAEHAEFYRSIPKFLLIEARHCSQ